MDAITTPPQPVNEAVRSYVPGSAEAVALERRIAELAAEPIDLTLTIGGRERLGEGEPVEVVQPHRHAAVLGTLRQATEREVASAVDAALHVAPQWRAMSFDERAATFLEAADLLAGPWRDTLNAATILGQSKSVYQAEIDSACELIDFWRFNVAYGRQILAEQPLSTPGAWNRCDYRPLEGFVLAITPFNFTSIAANLPTAPALMGNVVVWKPSPTQQLAAHFTLRLLEAAGLPRGVINLVTGDGAAVSAIALTHPELAGVHFTGSTRTFRHLWATVGRRLERYRSYPRLVGETGGKDFVVVHASADPEPVIANLVRGAFEYQGQKCSAASRAYVPSSLWRSGLCERLVEETKAVRYGDVTDLSTFGGAVIDRRAFARLADVLDRAKNDPTLAVLVGGGCDDRVGWFVDPTIIVGSDPGHDVFRTEYFGPILSVFVYEDDDWPYLLHSAADVAPYALSGAVFATDRRAIGEADEVLRFAAGNFYVNDKPTGAVVGQQPFGGARASGTNDKAGSPLNLLRWVSPRTIKETFAPARDWRYPHMG